EMQADDGEDGRFGRVGVFDVDREGQQRNVRIGVGRQGESREERSDFLVQNIVDMFVDDTEVQRIVVMDREGKVLAAASPEDLDKPQTDEDVSAFCLAFLENPNREEYAVQRFADHAGVVTTMDDPWSENLRALYIQYPATSVWTVLHERIGLIAGTSLIMIVAGVLMSLALGRRLSGPIKQLSKGAVEIGAGNLGYRFRIETGDEIQTLGESFNRMAGSLQDYMRDLAHETARRESLESELRIAAELQRSLLPERPPQIDGLDLAGWSWPATHVGGDFYDYVEMGPGRLGIVIGDATGKGLPAALLTTECWSVLKALAGDIHSPAELLYRTNNALCNRLGEDGRFVTLFLMVIDMERGVIDYSVAGHNPPILVSADQERTTLLTSRTGFPLGLQKDCRFTDIEVPLTAKDTILLYSDGLTEAEGGDDTRYGEERLADSVRNALDRPLPDLVTAVRNDIENYVGNTEVRDDMTVVGVRFQP
ncbi:MAG: PP2C family protein-serine/threonine phosphatase, partial [Candidatus Krumholzibacteria bacterium]|nr:PP2C family protein-serine/threonine phosphatase [Candidatus Krumholzibacteria bacterium]